MAMLPWGYKHVKNLVVLFKEKQISAFQRCYYYANIVFLQHSPHCDIFMSSLHFSTKEDSQIPHLLAFFSFKYAAILKLYCTIQSPDSVVVLSIKWVPAGSQILSSFRSPKPEYLKQMQNSYNTAMQSGIFLNWKNWFKIPCYSF